MKAITRSDLQKVIENHKLWLTDNNKGKRLNLINFDLSGEDLSNNDFSQAVFLDCNLENAKLDKCNFTEAKVKYCKLNYATAKHCNFTDAEMIRNILEYVDFTGSNFFKADLNYSSFNHSMAKHCNFTDADLRGCILKDCNLRNSNLFSADLFCIEYDNNTVFPKGTKLLTGYRYDIFIHQGQNPSKLDGYQVGCQNFTAEEWLSKNEDDLIDMDGINAIEFYPELVEIIKFFSKL